MNIFLAWLYLWATFFISAALSGVVIFAYAVTDKDSGRAGPNQVYLGHYLLTILVAGAELLGRRWFLCHSLVMAFKPVADLHAPFGDVLVDLAGHSWPFFILFIYYVFFLFSFWFYLVIYLFLCMYGKNGKWSSDTDGPEKFQSSKALFGREYEFWGERNISYSPFKKGNINYSPFKKK